MALMSNGLPMGIQEKAGSRGIYHPESGVWLTIGNQNAGKDLSWMDAQVLLKQQKARSEPEADNPE